MKKKELSEMTIEELKQQATSIKVVGWFLLGALLILLCILIYMSIINSEIQTLFVIPIACFPIVLLLSNNLKKINTEIKNRG